MTPIRVPLEALEDTLFALADELEHYTSSLPAPTTDPYPDIWLVYRFQRASQLEKMGLSGIDGGRAQFCVLWMQSAGPGRLRGTAWEYVECWGLTEAAFGKFINGLAGSDGNPFERMESEKYWFEEAVQPIRPPQAKSPA